MKLRRRQKGKKDQVLDSFASVVKSLADLHVAERAGKGAKTGAKNVSKGVKKASGLKAIAKSTPAKVLGGAAVVGSAGALIAKKLKGGDPEPIYTPPAPAEPMAVAPERDVEAVAADAAQAAAADASAAPTGSEAGVGAAEQEIAAVPELTAVPLLPAEPETAAGEADASPEAEPDTATTESDAGTGDDTPDDPAATEPPGEGAEEPVTDGDQSASSSETWST